MTAKLRLFIHRTTLVLWLSLTVLLAAACSASSDEDAEAGAGAEQEVVKEAYQIQQQVPMTLEISTSSLKETGYLQQDFTCEGTDSSPQLTWTEVPPDTQSIAIVTEDLDAEEGAFAHWLMWGLPPDTTEMAGGLSRSPDIPRGSVEGTNGYGIFGWKGPCPPPRIIMFGGSQTAQNTGTATHRYVLSVYALDTDLLQQSNATRDEVLRALDGHILASGNLELKYLSSQIIRR